MEQKSINLDILKTERERWHRLNNAFIDIVMKESFEYKLINILSRIEKRLTEKMQKKYGIDVSKIKCVHITTCADKYSVKCSRCANNRLRNASLFGSNRSFYEDNNDATENCGFVRPNINNAAMMCETCGSSFIKIIQMPNDIETYHCPECGVPLCKSSVDECKRILSNQSRTPDGSSQLDLPEAPDLEMWER